MLIVLMLVMMVILMMLMLLMLQVFFFFFETRRGQFIEMELSTRRPQASFRKPRVASKNQVYLLLSSSPPSWTRSWNFFITLLLHCLAFLHDQQEVVGREPPGGPVPLRGLVMSLPLSVLLAK